MSQKTMIALAAFLTAFILVIAGGVFTRVSSLAAAAQPTAAISPDVLELWSQREAAYQDLIDMANQRLLAAEQPPATSTAPVAASQSTLSTNLSSMEAAWLALLAAPGARLTAQPEMVLFQGVTAYEVPTTYGMVYVDAATGAILYNGTARAVAVSPSYEREDNEDQDDD